MGDPTADVWQVAALVRFDTIQGEDGPGPMRPLPRPEARKMLCEAELDGKVRVDLVEHGGPGAFRFNMLSLAGAVMGGEGVEAVLGLLGRYVEGRFVRQGVLYVATERDLEVHHCQSRQDAGRTVSAWWRLV